MPPRILPAALFLGLGLAIAGCGGGDDHPRRHNREAMGGAGATPLRPVMEGTQSFFGGKIVVDASLSEDVHRGGAGNDATGDGAADESGDGEGGSSRGRHRGHRGGGGEGYLGGPGMAESNQPPLTLRLHISNTSDAPLVLTFNGCDSRLGNFVVTPEKLTIAAGQSAEPNPMRSLLGIPGDEVPVELALAIPGKSETKTITVRLEQPASKMKEVPGMAPVPAPPPSVP